MHTLSIKQLRTGFINISNVITKKGLAENAIERIFEKHRLYKVQSNLNNGLDIYGNVRSGFLHSREVHFLEYNVE